jgi:hypothetical protein
VLLLDVGEESGVAEIGFAAGTNVFAQLGRLSSGGQHGIF